MHVPMRSLHWFLLILGRSGCIFLIPRKFTNFAKIVNFTSKFFDFSKFTKIVNLLLLQTQGNLVAALNVLASQIATALDTLNFALAVDRNSESDPRMVPRPPRNSRHGLRPRIITERITSDRSRTPPCTRTRPLDTSSTWYIPEMSPPRDVRREVPGLGTEHDPRPGALVDRLPQPRVPAPIAANTDRGSVTTPTSTPDSDSDRSVRPHPGASSFRPSPTVVLVNFCRSSRLPSAMRTMNHSRRGHKVSWMRWSGAKKTRTPGPPARLLPAPSKSPQAWKVYQQT